MEDHPLSQPGTMHDVVRHERQMLLAYTYQRCGGTDTVERAVDYAARCHAGQSRDGGEPYIIHPIRVAIHLTVFYEDEISQDDVAVAVLHDVLEDTPGLTREELAAAFGDPVATAVDCLSRKTARRKMSISEYYQAILAAPKLVKVIKLCDRLDNILSLHTCPDRAKIRRYVEFTNSHYPRLGAEAHHGLTAVILSEVIRIERSSSGEI